MQSLLEEIEFRNPARARGDAEILAAMTVPVARQVTRLLESLPDPDEALHFLGRFRRESPSAFRDVCASPTALSYLLNVFSYSSFLSEAVILHPGWLLDLTEPAAGMHCCRTAEDYAGRSTSLHSAHDLAAFRRREVLRILLRDVLGLGTLSEITEELSNLADAILGAAWQPIRKQLGAHSSGDRFAVLSLGKLGGRELNYSSDIDLMFVYSGLHGDVFKRAAIEFTEVLSVYTAEGMCYRVDLRLRPDGRYGEICQSLEGAKRYYRDRARDWELQMLIKARVSAGDAEPGRALLDFAEPLIYSDSLNPQAMESVSEARERIREKVQRSQRDGLDIKLARGGIRDVEFLVQCLQRLHGARDPWVRHGGTRMALFRLRGKGLLSDSEYARLDSAYEFLRHLEHRLQFQEDRQTHTLPSETDALDLLARKMPGKPGALANAGTLERELDSHLSAVGEIYDRVIHSGRDLPHLPRVPEKYARMGRGNERLESFFEQVAAEPDWRDTLERSPEVATCMLDLFEHSGFFGDQLVRHPELLTQVAGACVPNDAPNGFAAPDDVSGLRQFFRERMIRIQTESLCRRAPIFETLKQTSDLADAVIAGAYRIATGDDSLDHMMVIALGRLGMREFDLASDADLVFVLPDRHAAEMKFWTSVAERAIQAISVYTGDGVLFTVDTRLRPNGREGALVQTESAFKDYFMRHAEAWEGISYMKARRVAGDADRATIFLRELQEVDWRRYGQNGRSRMELAAMRARLEKEQGARNSLKAGAGGYYDIDFALLYYRLKGAGLFYPALNTPERIDVVEKMGHLEREDAAFLLQAATFYRAIDHGLRVSTGHAEGRLPTAPALLTKLTGLVGRWDHSTEDGLPLDERLNQVQSRTRAFFDRVFG